MPGVLFPRGGRHNGAPPAGLCQMIVPAPTKLLTIDLDDTLWPCEPPIRLAEALLADWLAEAAPAWPWPWPMIRVACAAIGWG